MCDTRTELKLSFTTYEGKNTERKIIIETAYEKRKL